DRLLSLAFSERSLEVQRKVVIEEFKESYLNKPYGDVWFHLRELAYQVHPYRWMTIGKALTHIEQATLPDVEQFFFKHYRPVNAILVVAGPVPATKVMEWVHKWFSDIPSGEKYVRHLPAEPLQQEARRKVIHANVPLDAFYKCWHMDSRLQPGYFAADLITEVLGGGGSSRLYQKLVKEQQLFSAIDCYHMGSVEAGILTIEGKLIKGIHIQDAEAAVEEVLEELKTKGISEKELIKVKNKTESSMAFEDMSILSRANNLAFYELLGSASLFHTDRERYFSITNQDMLYYSQQIFNPANSNTLHYLHQN
ncbi:MAG: M16 family metallopeptidase, partial [Chitinophagaceae bacterium]